MLLIAQQGFRSRLPVVCALIFVAIGASVGLGDIIAVPADYPTIQAGINAARNGDEVVVSPGTYFENINFAGKDITVRSVDPLDPAVVESTIIDGRALNSVVTMDRGVVSGFTIRNGRALSGDRNGGGVYLKYAPDQDGEISHNVITDCVAGNGGGIASRGGGENSIHLIRDNILTNNLAWGEGAISVVGGIVLNNVISFNETCCWGTGPHGAGIAAFGSAVIRDNLIFGNYSDEAAGGVLVENDVVLENNLIVGNQCLRLGGGVLSAFSHRGVVRNNTIVGNGAAFGLGGGVYAEGGGSIDGNIIAFSNLGEGIYIWFQAPVIADYNCVFGNADGDYGGRKDPGEHDINADPLFVDPLGPDGIPWTEDDNLRLTPDSPCINASDPEFIPEPGETDLDGHARILCDRVDIGAYEFGIGDYDCDRDVDLFDYEQWLICFTGPNNPPNSPLGKGGHRGVPDGCEAFDSDADGDMDWFDYATYQLAFTGP